MILLSYNLKMASFVALFGFNLYLIYKIESQERRKKMQLVMGIIMIMYFTGKFLE